MARIIDITEKLNFEESPKLIIKGEEIEINNKAVDVLKITPTLEKGGLTAADILTLYQTLFSEESREKIESLGLTFDDFSTVIMQAAQMLVGGGEGEAPTPTTT